MAYYNKYKFTFFKKKNNIIEKINNDAWQFMPSNILNALTKIKIQKKVNNTLRLPKYTLLSNEKMRLDIWMLWSVDTVVIIKITNKIVLRYGLISNLSSKYPIKKISK